MRHRLKLSPKVLFAVLAFIAMAMLAAHAQAPQEFIDLDQKVTSGGCALWHTFYKVFRILLLFGAAYAFMAYWIGNANNAMKAAIYVGVAAVGFIVVVALIRFFLGGNDPCTTPGSFIGPQNFKVATSYLLTLAG